jgi:ligand-binding sensor domain-containing protein
MVVCALVLMCAQVIAQGSVRIGQWNSYTDMSAVRAATVSADSIWAATAGGVFLYQHAARRFTTFTNSEGISSNDVTATTIDRQGRVWIGMANGFVNVYDPATGRWTEIGEIRDSNRPQKGIRCFFAVRDTVFIGTDFGVVVFVPSRWEFGDTYANFGFATRPRVNGLLVHRNTLWVATEGGIARASLTQANLSSPTAWSRFLTGAGTASRNVTSVSVFRDTVVFGTGTGLWYYGDPFYVKPQQFEFKHIVALSPVGSSLWVLVNNAVGYAVETVSSLEGTPTVLASSPEGRATAMLVRGTSELWVGTTQRGLARWTGTAWEFVRPTGPRSNLFISVAVDDRGVVWGASGISDRGRGFYRFDPTLEPGNQWKNFHRENDPVMASDDYYKVSIGSGGTVWASAWGYGVVEVVKDTVRRRIHATSRPSLAGAVPQDPNFVVVGSVVPDASGGTWFVNRSAINGFYLARLTGDTTMAYFSKTVFPAEGRLTNMVIDRFGTKWIASSEPFNKPATGLVYFNENPAIVSGTQATNGWGLLTAPSIPDNNVLALALDQHGDVCVGTDAGMVMIVNPRAPQASGSIRTVRPVVGQVVQAIAVDAVNNKWVGTREGIVVTSPDGTFLLHHYTVESTGGKLIDNDIRSIAIDQRRGMVYVGTESGLSSLAIGPVQSVRSYTTLEFAPNPFVLPAERELVITNLVRNSSIKILSSSGALVSEFSAQGGGRAFWDGRDRDGQLVSSGIYFIVAYAENGSQVSTGKVAVVRK